MFCLQCNVHNNLAIAVCNEVLVDPDSYNSQVLLRALTQLDLILDDAVTLQNIKTLTQTVVEVCTLQLQSLGTDLQHVEVTIKFYFNKSQFHIYIYIIIIISVVSFTANSGTKAAILPKGRSSIANSGTYVAVLLGMNRCGSFPLLSAHHSLQHLNKP